LNKVEKTAQNVVDKGKTHKRPGGILELTGRPKEGKVPDGGNYNQKVRKTEQKWGGGPHGARAQQKKLGTLPSEKKITTGGENPPSPEKLKTSKRGPHCLNKKGVA